MNGEMYLGEYIPETQGVERHDDFDREQLLFDLLTSA